VANLTWQGVILTGLVTSSPELRGKGVELFHAVVPRLARVAGLWNPANPHQESASDELTGAAQVLSGTATPGVSAGQRVRECIPSGHNGASRRADRIGRPADRS
jgi:hypothetical protein